MTIIAECGINHNGDMQLAKRMIESAMENGADLVKFQLYDSDKIGAVGIHREAELSHEQARFLFDYGASIGIEVFFSVFDVERVGWCEDIGVKRYKIATRMRDEGVMKAVAETKKPVIMSMNDTFDGGYHCGSTEARVDYLHCISEYPVTNLHFEAGMWEDHGGGTLGSSDGRREYHKDYEGFSDHTIGIDAAKIALARGAEIIEKHFTLDKTMEGPDHKLSMEPNELRELVRWQKVCQEVL